MSREKDGFRDTIADLNRVFPIQGTLSKTEVARYLGVDRSTVNRRGIPFNAKTGRIAKADLARFICI